MAWEEAIYVVDEILESVEKNQSSGLPPSNMKGIYLNTVSNGIKINGEFPDDTVIDGKLLCTVAGVKIVRKLNSAPTGINDGTLIKNIVVGESRSFIITDNNGITAGQTYYYHFYPYSDHGVFNLNDANVRSITAKAVKIHRYSFEQLFYILDPGKTIIYPTQVDDNAGFTPMMTNESNGTATAGSWGSFLTDVLKNKPYMVRRDGTADYALDPNDYTKKLDGTPSDYNNLNYDGGAFAWINKVYVRETYASNSEGTNRMVEISDSKINDSYYPRGFIDPDGNELEGVWIPMGYMDNAGRVLIAGTTPNSGKTVQQAKTLIDAFSPRAVFFGGPIIPLLRDLEYMLFKSTDIQKAAGYGMSSFQSEHPDAAYPFANANPKNGIVPGWYGNNGGASRNKYFHSMVVGTYAHQIMDPYLLRTADGSLKYSSNYSYDLTGDSYTETRFSIPETHNWLWPSNTVLLGDDFGSIPDPDNTHKQGSSTTGLCDGSLYQMSGTDSVRLAMHFGDISLTVKSGPAFLNFSWGPNSSTPRFIETPMLLPPPGYSPQP